jgi:hypothetical protein
MEWNDKGNENSTEPSNVKEQNQVHKIEIKSSRNNQVNTVRPAKNY